MPILYFLKKQRINNPFTKKESSHSDRSVKFFIIFSCFFQVKMLGFMSLRSRGSAWATLIL